MKTSFPLLCLILAALVPSARASLTLVQREPFQGVGTLDSATPGNLGTVSGSFFKRAGGPLVSGAAPAASGDGWSADLRRVNAAHVFATIPGGNSPSAASRMIGAWYRFDAITDDGSAGRSLTLLGVYQNNGYTSMGFSVDKTFTLTVVSNAGGSRTDAAAAPVLTPGQWCWLALAWTPNPVGGYFDGDFRAYYRVPGGALTLLTTVTSVHNGYGSTSTLQGGATGANITANARYGAASHYTIAGFADVAYPSDVADPVSARRNWYLNPATGNDNNDGTTAATAWASVAKLNAESANLGMFPVTTGYATGDTVTIDTSGANLLLGTASLKLLTQGLNVVQTGGGEIQAWTPIAPSSWSLVSGQTAVWQHTLTESEPSIVMWEADKWLHHVTASSLTAAAASDTGATFATPAAACAAVPGTFYTDGTTLICSTFGGTNPTTDGLARTRSYHRNAPNGDSAVQMLAPDLHLKGLVVRKTCLADNATSDPVLAYCFQSQSAAGGTSLIESCAGYYGSKHVFGFTDSATNRRFTVLGCVAEQGSAYAGAGGTTPWVDYSGVSGTLDNQTAYVNCTTAKTRGLIGSTAGQTLLTLDVCWLSHGSGSSFSKISFTGCNFDTPSGDEGSVAVIALSGCTMGGFASNAATFTVDQCRSTGYPFTLGNVNGSGLVTNSVITCGALVWTSNSFFNVAGHMVYRGVTIDARAAVTGGNNGFLARGGTLNILFQNCVLLSASTPAAAQLSLLEGLSTSDTVATDHCAFASAGGTAGTFVVAHNYNDGTTTSNRTLAQWQTLGKDAGSFVTAAPTVDANYVPQTGGALINAGIDLGMMADLTGRVRLHRQTIGAFEPAIPRTLATQAAVRAALGL